MGCAQSVEDKRSAGTWTQGGQGQASAHWQAEAAAAVAELLGPGAAVQVEISVKCFKLPDKDVFSKSDPMAVLFMAEGQQGQQGKWTEVDRSEVVANSLNPEFPRPLRATYAFERLQHMRLVVYDADVRAADSKRLNLGQQDFLAQGRFLLSDLLTASGQTLRLPLTDAAGSPLPGCTALLSAEELPNTNAIVTLSMSAAKLDNKDTFSKSDPFLLISKGREGGQWVPVLKTEVKNNNLNPTWAPFKASMAQLCNCDSHRPLLLEVLDHNSSGSHDLIGHCQATLQQLQDAAAQTRPLPLINPKKTGRPSYVNSGTLTVRSAQVVPRPSFLDYIRGGLQLNFLVAVDYTASNRSPMDPSSLHYLTPSRPTMYEEAILAVGAVLERYDTDRRFPAWGFGAALPPSGTTSHCFPLNGNPADPEVEGVQGILEAYRQTLKNVRLSGPTLFAPVINAAAQMASHPSSHLQYFCLLILTDGCIMDMANTLTSLVDASRLPLSLLIVGVGNEDFRAMEVLDGDEQRIQAPDGRRAARDFVQFVPFRPQQRDTVEELTAKLLAELPGQLVEYFHDMMHIPPSSSAPPPPAVSATAGSAPGGAHAFHAMNTGPPPPAVSAPPPPDMFAPPPPPATSAPPPPMATPHNAGFYPTM